jgi:hypothetical protein
MATVDAADEDDSDRPPAWAACDRRQLPHDRIARVPAANPPAPAVRSAHRIRFELMPAQCRTAMLDSFGREPAREKKQTNGLLNAAWGMLRVARWLLACCTLHAARYMVCCTLYAACCMLHVVCCMLYATHCMLHVVCCMLCCMHAACRMLHCCMLCVACCMVCCMLHVGTAHDLHVVCGMVCCML